MPDVGKVCRWQSFLPLVALISAFINNFDIYIDRTYDIGHKGEDPSGEKPTRNTPYTTVVRAPTMADFVVEKYDGGVQKTIAIYLTKYIFTKCNKLIARDAETILV